MDDQKLILVPRHLHILAYSKEEFTGCFSKRLQSIAIGKKNETHPHKIKNDDIKKKTVSNVNKCENVFKIQCECTALRAKIMNRLSSSGVNMLVTERKLFLD